jgi:hypothetical protein
MSTKFNPTKLRLNIKKYAAELISRYAAPQDSITISRKKDLDGNKFTLIEVDGPHKFFTKIISKLNSNRVTICYLDGNILIPDDQRVKYLLLDNERV